MRSLHWVSSWYINIFNIFSKFFSFRIDMWHLDRLFRIECMRHYFILFFISFFEFSVKFQCLLFELSYELFYLLFPLNRVFATHEWLSLTKASPFRFKFFLCHCNLFESIARFLFDGLDRLKLVCVVARE